MSMHVYANDVTDWFIAESPEDAVAVARQWYLEVCRYDLDETDLDFVQEPDDRVLRIDLNDDGVIVEKTCAEWAASEPRGFLCSTEF